MLLQGWTQSGGPMSSSWHRLPRGVPPDTSWEPEGDTTHKSDALKSVRSEVLGVYKQV